MTQWQISTHWQITTTHHDDLKPISWHLTAAELAPYCCRAGTLLLRRTDLEFHHCIVSRNNQKLTFFTILKNTSLKNTSLSFRPTEALDSSPVINNCSYD